LGREGGVEPPSPGWSPGALTEAMLPPHREKQAKSRSHYEAFLHPEFQLVGMPEIDVASSGQRHR
jgi:hypothetical protein